MKAIYIILTIKRSPTTTLGWSGSFSASDLPPVHFVFLWKFVLFRSSLCLWENNGNGCSFARSALQLQLCIVVLCCVLYNGQPQSRAAGLP